MMICLRRMHDVDGVDDPYCVRCGNGESLYRQADWLFTSPYYADREECYEENVVSEKEFDAIEKCRLQREQVLDSLGS